MSPPDRRGLAAVHGAYYVASGVWPLVSMSTFERVTGPKTDSWLVRLVGLLAAAIGAILLRDAARWRCGSRPDRDLAVAAATAFAAVDAWYGVRGRIAPVYLADAAVEIALAAAWLAPAAGGGRSHRFRAAEMDLQHAPASDPRHTRRR